MKIKAIVVLVLFPFLTFAQTLQIGSGVSLTRSTVTASQPSSTYKSKVVLPGFYAEAMIGLVVNPQCQLQTGVRRIQYKAGVEYGPDEGTVVYRQTFWQIPLLFNLEVPVYRSLRLTAAGGANSFRPASKDVYATQTTELNEPRTYYRGGKYEFGYEAGCGVSYLHGDNAFALQYRYAAPFETKPYMELDAYYHHVKSVSGMAVHCIGASYRRRL